MLRSAEFTREVQKRANDSYRKYKEIIYGYTGHFLAGVIVVPLAKG